MPYASSAQRRFMHAKHPGIAKRWDKEYPDQKGLPEHVKKKHSEKKSSNEGRTMSLIESVVDAFQANAAAIGKAEEIINEKQAAEHAYGELIPKVVDICAKFGKIDDTAEEKQALASMLATPAGALDVIAKLAAFADEGAPSSIGGQQVDSKGRAVHMNGQQKRASYDSLQNPHVGSRQSERDNKSWTDFPRNLGIQ